MQRLLVAAFLVGSALLGLAEVPKTSASAAVAPAAESDTVQLGHGLNLAQLIEFTSEDGGKGNRGLSEEDFARIHDAGFTLVRVPIQWAKHTGPAPDFKIEPDFFTKIDWVVAQAGKNHLQVVIDNHKDEELWNDPAATTDRFVAMWKQIAEHYKGAPPSIVFELQNEPHKALNDAWNDLFPKALAAVRATNPTRAVVIDCVNFAEIRSLPKLKLPPNDSHLVVSIHYYDPMNFTHQGASWIPNSKSWLGTKWEGTDAERQEITREFKFAGDWGAAHHCPIYLGEFGSGMKADLDSRLRWTRAIVAAAKANGFSWTYWDYHGGFGVYDQKARQWRQPLLDALLEKPEPKP